MIRSCLFVVAMTLSATGGAQTPVIGSDGLVAAGSLHAPLHGVERPVGPAQRERWQELFDLLPWTATASGSAVELRWQEHLASRLLVQAGAAVPVEGFEIPETSGFGRSAESTNIISINIDGLTYPPVERFVYDLANYTFVIDSGRGMVCETERPLPQYPLATLIGILDGHFLLLANRSGHSLLEYRLDDDLISIVSAYGDYVCGPPSALRTTLEVARVTWFGDPARFVLKVFNETDVALSAPVIDVVLPAGVELLSAGGDGWSCQAQAPGLRCQRATLAAEANHRIAIEVEPLAVGEVGLSCTAGMASSGEINDAGCGAVTDVQINLDPLFKDRFEVLVLNLLSRWSAP